MIISICLSAYLKISLLFISGVLLCFLIYALENQEATGIYSGRLKKYFYLSVLVTLGAKSLFLMKDIFQHHDSIHESLKKSVTLYKVCSVSASYQSFGFIRRGLIPTLVTGLSSDYIFQIYAVQLLGLIIFITALAAIIRKKNLFGLNRNIYAIVLLLSPIGIFSYFNFNLGFTDMILVGLLLISISFSGNWFSFIVDITGMLIHEAFLFIRLPFLILQLFINLKDKKPYQSTLAQIFINLGFFIIIILSPRPEMDALKSNYFTRYPMLVTQTTPGDMEAFIPLSKEGTLRSNFHVILQFYKTDKALSLAIPILISVTLIVVAGFFSNTLTGKNRALDVFAAAFIFIFPLMLSAVGGDFGRWLGFSFVCWATYYYLFRSVLFPKAEISYKYAYAVLVTALIFSPFGINYHPLFYKLLGY